MKPNTLFVNYAGLFCLLIAIMYLISRLFLTLDFTDEMQYYGEIYGLITSNSLFSNDLFIQQIGYLLVYPFFKLFYLANSDLSYFVIFGRLLYLMIALAAIHNYVQFIKSHRVEQKFAQVGTALLILFLAHQIFAISYNTLSSALLVIVLSMWFRRDYIVNTVLISLLCVAIIVSYPPVGIITVFLLICDLMYRKQFKLAFMIPVQIILQLTVFGIIVFGSGIIEWQELLLSIEFSRSFKVGSEFFDNKNAFIVLLAFWGLSLVSIWWFVHGVPKKINNVISQSGFKLFVYLIATAILFALAYSKYWKLMSFVMYFIILFSIFSDSKLSGRKISTNILKIHIIGTILSTVYVLISSNGIFHLPRGLLLMLPFLIILLDTNRVTDSLEGNVKATLKYNTPNSIYVLSLVIFTSLIVAKILHPYRAERFYTLDSYIENTPAFKGIVTSSAKSLLAGNALAAITKFDVKPNDTMLVIGANPWLYFVSQAHPKTYMIFMHFTGSKNAYNILTEKLKSLNPKFIIFSNVLPEKLIASFVSSLEIDRYNCSDSTIKGDTTLFEHHNLYTQYEIINPLRVCKILN